MKIGVFSDTFLPLVDGVGRVVYNYADHLSRKGHECTVVSTKVGKSDIKGLPFKVIECRGVPVIGASQYRYGLPLLDYRYSEAIRGEEFDIVHAHSPFAMGLEAMIIAHRQRIPLVATFHSKYYDDFKKIMRIRQAATLGARLVAGFYNRCDESWAVNNYAAGILKQYGYRSEVIVMPNGTPVFERDPADEELARSRFSIKESPVFLYVGQMNWKKNLIKTLEAAAILKGKQKGFSLVFAGKGTDLLEIQAKAKALGIFSDIIFTGHIEDARLLRGLYQSANLLIFPSLYDTAPMVLREAASAGLAAVVVKDSGPSEDIVNGVNGLVCDNNSENLAAVLEEHMSDLEFFRTIGQKAKETIFMPWDTVLDMALVRYEKVIKVYKGID